VVEHELVVVVVNGLDAQLLDVDVDNHSFRLSLVCVSHRSSNPVLHFAVYQEQLGCGDHRSGVRFGTIRDHGILCEKASGDSSEVGEDMEGVQAIG